MNEQLISQIDSLIMKFAPAIIIFVVGVVVAYNLRDMVVNWFIGLTLKWNKKYNEFDYFEIDGVKCLLTSIGSFRMVFLELNENNTIKTRLITIGNKQFISGKIIKLGNLFKV